MSSKSSHLNLYSASNESDPTLQVVSAAAKASVVSTSVLELKGTTVSLVNTADTSKNVADLATFLDGCSTNTALASETTARQNAITQEAASRAAAINSEAASRVAGLATEAQARNAAIATVTASVTSEASTRSAADVSLQNQIDTEKARIDAILAGSDVSLDTLLELVTAYESSDTSILSTITTLQAQVTAIQNQLDVLTDSNP